MGAESLKKIVPCEVNQSIPGILLLSHGDMALGMLDSAQIICGELDNMAAICIEPSDDLDEYKAVLLDTMGRFPAGVLVLVDLMSGTPFNTLMSIAGERRLYGIAGMNLPLLIEMAIMRDSKTLQEIAVAAEERIHASICDLGKLQEELVKATQVECCALSPEEEGGMQD